MTKGIGSKMTLMMIVVGLLIVTPLNDVLAGKRGEKKLRLQEVTSEESVVKKVKGRKWLNAKNQYWWDERFEEGIRYLLNKEERVKVRVRVNKSDLEQLSNVAICSGPGCAVHIPVKIKVGGKKYNGFVWKSWDGTGGVLMTIKGQQHFYSFPFIEAVKVDSVLDSTIINDTFVE